MSSVVRKAAIFGIGFMGKGISKNVLLKGNSIGLQEIFLYDLNFTHFRNEVAPLLKEQINSVKYTLVKEPKEILKEVDLVSLSLPSEEACEKLLFHEKSGILSGLRESAENGEKIIVDHSTFTKTFARSCSEKARKYGNIHYIDAPVSGGPQGAWDGSLSIMIGGEEHAAKRVIPFLELFSSKQKYFGSSGI